MIQVRRELTELKYAGIVQFLVSTSAIVLFLSALLKIWVVKSGQYPSWYFEVGKTGYVLIICVELWLSLLLLINATWMIRVGTCFMIGAFLSLNVYWAIKGEASCGCFGFVQVPPLAMAVFDAIWLGLMLIATLKLAHYAVEWKLLVLATLIGLLPMAVLWHEDETALIWPGSSTIVENAIFPVDSYRIKENNDLPKLLNLLVISAACTKCNRMLKDSSTISQFDGVVYSASEWLVQGEDLYRLSSAAKSVWAYRPKVVRFSSFPLRIEVKGDAIVAARSFD